MGVTFKGGYYDHFWIHRSKWSFWYQMKAPIFVITPVKFYVQHMLLVKVISEKRSESSVTTKFTTFESMDRLDVNFDISN